MGGSRAGPVVTPHTLELTARGRVTLLLAPPDTARAYLPPEYRPGRVYSDTDSEKVSISVVSYCSGQPRKVLSFVIAMDSSFFFIWKSFVPC